MVRISLLLAYAYMIAKRTAKQKDEKAANCNGCELLACLMANLARSQIALFNSLSTFRRTLSMKK